MRTFVLLIALTALGPGGLYAQQQPDLGTEAQREAGRQLYLQKCAQCHGEAGDADAVAAPFLVPEPRDFTTGIFKFRTTASGELPTDEDLKRSIREGMPYTGMPAWSSLSEQEVTNLVYFIKTFNDDFAGSYGVPERVEIPKAPSLSEEQAQRGRAVYEGNQCLDCHGQQGRGDGPSAPTLEDQWGHPIRPADLTKRWTFRNGQTRADIYRTFTTGLDGTPMPSYDMPEEDRWALVDYVYALSRDEPNYATTVVAEGLEDDLDISRGKALFEGALAAYFPVVGQIMQPGRAFAPGTNGVEVRAVYNQEDLAVMLTWHNMTAEKTGQNGPALAVPRFDPAADTTDEAFSDAVAVQWPVAMPEGTEKPYFLFGDEKRAVHLWFADLAGQEAALFVGRGSDDIEPADGAPDFTASYEDGEWTAIFKRKRVQEDGIAFEEGTFIPVAFSLWDGFYKERGNRRGLTSWYYLYMKPLQTQSAVLPMLKWGLLTLVLELGLIFFVRRKYGEQVAA